MGKELIKKVHLAILELYSGPTGKIGYYNNQSVGLAKALIKLGNFQVSIIIPDVSGGALEKMEINTEIRVIYVPSYCIGSNVFYNLHFLEKSKINVVQINSDNSLFTPAIVHYCLRHKLSYYFYLGTVFSNSSGRVNRGIMNLYTRLILLRYYRKAKVFVKTPELKSVLKKQGIKDITLMPVALDTSVIPTIEVSRQEARRQLKLPEDKKIILFLGRLVEEKRPIEALKLIKSLGEDYYLVLIGIGELKKDILKKIKEWELQLKVRYIEELPNKEVHIYYKACEYYVNYNEHEIYGMSILEAMYQGCVVVARRAPGPDFIIKHGESGYLGKTDMDIKRFIENDTEERVSKMSYLRIKTNFCWEKSAEYLIPFLNNKGLELSET